MMLALDLFCCAGGASMGLHRAGFDVVGLDIRRQPHYPFTFVQGDATRPPFDIRVFDLIWASPPCQRWTPHAQQHGTSNNHPDLVAPIRTMLRASAVPYIIENVPRSPVRPTAILTGCMFGLNTYRKRHFETSFAVLTGPVGNPFGPKSRPGSVTVSGHSGGSSVRDGWTNGNGADWAAALGIDWMTNAEMAEAIPPAYAEFLARAACISRSATLTGPGIALSPAAQRRTVLASTSSADAAATCVGQSAAIAAANSSADNDTIRQEREAVAGEDHANGGHVIVLAEAVGQSAGRCEQGQPLGAVGADCDEANGIGGHRGGANRGGGALVHAPYTGPTVLFVKG